METTFRHFTELKTTSTEPIEIYGRTINVIKRANNTIWFDFMAICGIPRSQNDFLVLARNYRTLLISDIPKIKPDQDSLITTFINLIDVLYDAHIRVIISAEVPVTELYTSGRKLFEFKRTESRLIEMQSEEYFYPGAKKPELTML